jgi:hypothetical protein
VAGASATEPRNGVHLKSRGLAIGRRDAASAEICVTFFASRVENGGFLPGLATLSGCHCDANSAKLRKLHEKRKKLEFAQYRA